MSAISPEHVENVIASEEYIALGEKTTICLLTLKNGYEIVGSSACVCAANYDHSIGSKYAREKAVSQIWPLLGYELQTRKACFQGDLGGGL